MKNKIKEAVSYLLIIVVGAAVNALCVELGFSNVISYCVGFCFGGIYCAHTNIFGRNKK